MKEKTFPILDFILSKHNKDTVPEIKSIKSLDDLDDNTKKWLIISQKINNGTIEYNFIEKILGQNNDDEYICSKGKRVTWNLKTSEKSVSKVYDGEIGDFSIHEDELFSVYDISAYKIPREYF